MDIKQYRISVLCIVFCAITTFCIAQTNPGTENLMHQWTFDDGTANDNVAQNSVHGQLHGGASISDKALVLSQQGQYLSLSGSALALHTYATISQEIWFTPKAGANTGFAHIVYFGTTIGNDGYNYLYTMPVRGDNASRVGISDASISNTVYVSGPEYDDGKLHHFVSVVRSDSLFFYIDGELADKKINTVPLTSISSSLAYLGKSGFTADPTWIGSISKYSIYNKSLSHSEVKYLYEVGAEDNPVIIVSAPSLHFPKPNSKKIAVWALHVSQEITLTASSGFTVDPSTLPANANADSVTITFAGLQTTEGYVYLQSGSVSQRISVTGSVDPALAVSEKHIVLDEINASSTFTVTGYNLASEIMLSAPAGINLSPSLLPANASDATVTVTYDGIQNSSGTVFLTSGTASSKITIVAARSDECFTPLYPGNIINDPHLNSDITGSGIRSITTNPDFVFCGSSSGSVSAGGIIERNLTGILKPNTEYQVKAKVYSYNPKIQPGNMGSVTYTLDLDSATYPQYYRLIKEAMDSACSYFNKYTPFVKDIYVYYSDGIPTAQASHLGAIGFGSNTAYMWVGTAIHEMAHYFGSGTSNTWRSLMSGGVWTGKAGSQFVASLSGETLKGDTQHYWPLGINYRSEVTNLGSQEAQHQSLTNTVMLIKAMLVDDCGYPTNNPSYAGIGVSGWNGSSDDLYYPVVENNMWDEIHFTFTTGNSIKTNPKIYFTSEMGYIDNWEMYEIKEESQISITLTKGWNLVSLPITLIDMSVASVFPNAAVVKNTESFYSAGQPRIFNTLTKIEEAHGYLVYNFTDETVLYTGVSLADAIVWPKNESWQLIGSPWLNSLLIEDALKDYSTNVEIVKNFDGHWQPSGTNSINHIEPGKAYFVK